MEKTSLRVALSNKEDVESEMKGRDMELDERAHDRQVG